MASGEGDRNAPVSTACSADVDILTKPMFRVSGNVRSQAFACCFILVSLHARAQPSGSQPDQGSAIQKAAARLQDYLNMAGSQTARDFSPLTQGERTNLFLKSLINPWGYFKGAMSAGIDQWNDKPSEWGQGAQGYGKRFANITGQYSVQKAVTFLASSALHEDNRYFGSGEHGIWPRTRYALMSSVLARHDSGRRSISLSQLGGVAAGAFIARLWLPSSQSSAADGAVSFGISMGGNAATSVLKEFLPDLLRRVVPKQRTRPDRHSASKPGVVSSSGS